jgi:hypothetical protein
MRRTYVIAAVLVMLFSCLVFGTAFGSGCGSEDPAYIGTWVAVSEVEGEDATITLSITSNSFQTVISFIPEVNVLVEVGYKGSYSVDDDTMSITVTGLRYYLTDGGDIMGGWYYEGEDHWDDIYNFLNPYYLPGLVYEVTFEVSESGNSITFTVDSDSMTFYKQ